MKKGPRAQRSALKVRVRAKNGVGWSSADAQISCRTAERPLKSRQLQCVEAGRSHVRIEFKVPLNYGQEEHISKVRVEQAGMLVWNELPSQSLEFECLDKVDSYSTEPTTEDIDLGPFWNAELKLRAFAVVVRGLEPNSHYTFRLDVANEVGWSRLKSDPFSCHTVCRPHVPKLREGPHCVPYELRVSWDQRDPLGGAVLEWEAQICESSLFTLFSSWAAAKDFLVLRQPTLHDMVCEDEELAINTTWEASFGCLKPAVEYVMRLRTGNTAGWSEWSEPLQAVTACPPSISRCSLVQVPGNMPGSQPDWIVDILVDERGSRAFLCAVDFSCTLRDATFVDPKSTLSSSTVARHIINGSWRARFPGDLLPAGSQKVSVTVTVANDAGWSATVRKSSEDTDGQTKTLSWDMPSTSTSPSALPAVAELGHSLKAFLVMMGEKLGDARKEMSSLSSATSTVPSRWTTEQLQRLSHRAERIDLAQETLRSLQAASGKPERCESWLASCGERLAYKNQVMDKERTAAKARVIHHVPLWEDFSQNGFATAGLLKDFELLVEGCMWLEHVRNMQLDPLWARLCHISGDGKQSQTVEPVGQHPARVVRLWADKREAWAARFDAQLVSITKQALTTAGQLLATARSLPTDAVRTSGFLRSALVRTDRTENLPDIRTNTGLACLEPSFCAELREQTLLGLTALKNLRTSADQQLRKLNRALQLLAVASTQPEHDGTGAPEGGAHSFPEVSVTDKLSQTALGLILTMVMPVPGTVELGVVSIGALWLQGDSAGKHLVVEHSPGPDFDPFGRFQQQARPSALKLLANWTQEPQDVMDATSAQTSDAPPSSSEGMPATASSSQLQPGTVLVHNAASRMITVRVLDQGRNIAVWAYEKVQEAHPMVRLVSQAVVRGFGAVAGNTWQADSVEVAVAVPPADVAIVPLPSMEDSSFELEFTYGFGGERPLGRVPARAGMAVSFVCLDDEIHIDNIDQLEPAATTGKHSDEQALVEPHQEDAADGACPEPPPQQHASSDDAGAVAAANGDDAKDAPPAGEGTQEEAAAPNVAAPVAAPSRVRVSMIRASNKDAVEVTLRFFHLGAGVGGSATHHFGRFFRKPVVVATVGPGEMRTIRLEVRHDTPGPDGQLRDRSQGPETSASSDSSDSHGDLFEVVAETAASSSVCNVRDLQFISYEGGL